MVRVLSPEGLAVLNGDDPHVRWMATQTVARTVTVGFGKDNDVRATDVRLDWPRGTRITLQANGKTWTLTSRLLGTHLVYPILAAIAVALAEGVPVEAALPRLERLTPSPRRLEPTRLDSGAVLIRDEFKGTPESFRAALNVLADVPVLHAPM